MGPNGWQVRWRLCIDNYYTKLLDLPEVPNLETVDPERDSADEQRRKMKARFQVYQTLYRRLNGPLTMRLGDSIKTVLVIECTSRGGFDLCEWATVHHVQSSLFKGLQFYLPRSTDVIMETDRWRLELLIKVCR